MGENSVCLKAYIFGGLAKMRNLCVRTSRLAISVVFLLLSAPLGGLASSSEITGRVLDPSGAVIVEAQVTATNVATNIKRTTSTNEQGIYRFLHLPPGEYNLRVSHAGFRATDVLGIVVHVTQTAEVNVTLRLGSVVQTVTVEGGRIYGTQGPAVGTVVDRQFVENLPLNGRSFQQLITLTPGVVLTKTGFARNGEFSVNGQRANSNYFTVDGVSANFGMPPTSATGLGAGGTVPALTTFGGTNALVSVDAMQEFRIQTSTYAPEFGRQSGGQISIVTRSGTNEFHGTVFEYFRNDKLDANDWFANQQGLEKPPLRQNDFGGVLGGPIVPDKTFFFFSYEGLRLRQPRVSITSVPSVASRQAAVPEVQPFLNAYPVPNGPDLAGGFAQLAGSFSDQTTLDATSIRVDHTFNDKWTLFGRYSHAPSDTVVRGGATFSLASLSTNTMKTQALTLGSTQIFTPNVSNELRANLSRAKGFNFSETTDFGGAVPLPESLLFPPFASRNDSTFFFQILGGGTILFDGKAGANQQRQVNLVDNLSVIAGAHQLKFGVDYRWLSPVQGSRAYNQVNVFLNATQAASGTAFLVFVQASEEIASVFTNFSAYAQDTWRVTPRLTLTYGLRWDVNPAPHGKNGKELFVVTGVDGDPANFTLAPPGELFDTTYNNFAPRVGVAYQLSQKPGKETVLRGGFGLFYDLGASYGTGLLAINFPHLVSKTLFFVPFPLDAATAAPPPPADPSNPVGAGSTGFAPDFKLPRTYQWNLALEQSLGSNQTVSASYVAAVGRRLLRREQVLNPNPSFSRVDIVRNAATSDYHAMQLQFNRRLSRGLQALASYTWSHSIDIASAEVAVGGRTGSAVVFFDPNTDRGDSEFDVRHNFRAAVTYNIPSPAQGGVGRAVLGDWSIDTIVTVRSSTPVDLIGASLPSPFSIRLRPDLVPGEPLYLDDLTVAGGRRFNPAAFDSATPLSQNRQGTLGRNVLRGFGLRQVDFSLRRQFHLTEKLNLQFRAEFFNLFNHPNFGDPEGSTTSGLFGQSTQMLGRSLGTGAGGGEGGFNPLYQIGGPRSIQLALKLTF